MSLNNFKTSVVKGFMSNTGSIVLRSALIDSSAEAGVAVKLSGYNNGTVVTPITASTDAIYGFVPYTAKKDAFVANDVVRVAVDNAIIVMEASEAITVGALLEIDPTTMKVGVQSTGTLVGTALQVASADGDLIKVEIKK